MLTSHNTFEKLGIFFSKVTCPRNKYNLSSTLTVKTLEGPVGECSSDLAFGAGVRFPPAANLCMHEHTYLLVSCLGIYMYLCILISCLAPPV